VRIVPSQAEETAFLTLWRGKPKRGRTEEVIETFISWVRNWMREWDDLDSLKKLLTRETKKKQGELVRGGGGRLSGLHDGVRVESKKSGTGTGGKGKR